MAGMGVLVAGDLVLAKTSTFAGVALGTFLWGAHMALTQGIFSRMIADSAREWWAVLRGGKPVRSTETPFDPLIVAGD